jgi:putative endonuclease
MTKNLERRLREHNSGHTKSTRNNEWEIIYKEELMDRVSARKREKYLKSAAGRRYLQKYLASYLPD